MFETPASTHGYLSVVAVSWVYVLLALAITFALRAVGVTSERRLYAFVTVALVLATPFVSLFSEYTP